MKKSLNIKLKNNKIIIIVIVCLFILLAGIIGFSTYSESRITDIGYKDFKSMVEKKEIEKVTIGESKLTFKKKDDTNTYRTDNPDSQDFREYLLLNDVFVEDDFDTLIIFDILFYGIFFGAVRIWNI